MGQRQSKSGRKSQRHHQGSVMAESQPSITTSERDPPQQTSQHGCSNMRRVRDDDARGWRQHDEESMSKAQRRMVGTQQSSEFHSSEETVSPPKTTHEGSPSQSIRLVYDIMEKTATPVSATATHGQQEEDALFDAYTGFMAATLMQPSPNSEPDSWRISAVTSRQSHADNHTMSFDGHSYVASMKHVIDVKKNKAQQQKKIATGVTRRFMHEVQIAKENMFIYQRLLHMSPSADVDRKHHYKDFAKSRALLGKMSRYDVHSTPHGAQKRPEWIDSF